MLSGLDADTDIGSRNRKGAKHKNFKTRKILTDFFRNEEDRVTLPFDTARKRLIRQRKHFIQRCEDRMNSLVY